MNAGFTFLIIDFLLFRIIFGFQGQPGDIPNYITEFRSGVMRGPPGPPVCKYLDLEFITLPIVSCTHAMDIRCIEQ